MPSFSYTARDRNGQAQHGQREAATAVQLSAQLSASGLIPVRIQADPTGAGPAAAATGGAATAAAASPPEKSKAKRADPRAITLSLRELAALLKAGIPIMRALRLVSETSDSPTLRASYTNLIDDLDSGRELADAMDRERERSQSFEAYDVAMVRVGERTGRLDRALRDLYHHREFMRQTAEQISSALRYPIFVVATCVLALVVINILVIPSFAKVFASVDTELPLLTRVLLGGSQFFVQWWPALAATALAGGWVARKWRATPAGRLLSDRWLLKVPLVGPICYRIVLARFASSLASSLASGLPVPPALQATSQTLGNAHMVAAMDRLQRSVERGESLSRATAASGAFPAALVQILTIGEESGTLDELLQEMAQHYHSETEYAVRRLSAYLEPLLIVVFGGAVLVMALGVFMPMWELGRASVH